MANKMRLYQHSARCSVALRSFLDCNPNYWRFVPMLWYDAQAEKIAAFRERSSSSSSNTDPEMDNVIAMGAISNRRVAHSLDHVPLSPAAYAFSYEQRRKQYLFFGQFLLSPVDHMPYSTIDLYKMAIIAVRKRI
jgi:hypothetical protein